jgi:hypothetical protein
MIKGHKSPIEGNLNSYGRRKPVRVVRELVFVQEPMKRSPSFMRSRYQLTLEFCFDYLIIMSYKILLSHATFMQRLRFEFMMRWSIVAVEPHLLGQIVHFLNCRPAHIEVQLNE